uniref:FYVE-type domain-containing protein n=1 Tax=Globisporangium ultimum (strain ATCC 200006 / CBS 805.95 / DAOM BR144) TaxID=431595 RepID=K3WDL0_GLOUD
MDRDFLHAINGDWDALLVAMRESRSLVHRTDSSGMSILHWICLHQDIPTDVVIKVVFANPHAVRLRNDAGHLPIDLAVQAECSERTLEILRAAYSGAEDHTEEPEPPLVEMEFGHSYFDNNSMLLNQPLPSHFEQPRHVQSPPAGGYHQNNRYGDEPSHQMIMYSSNNNDNDHDSRSFRGRNESRDYPEDDDDRYSARPLPHTPAPSSIRSRRPSMPQPRQQDNKPLHAIYSDQIGTEPPRDRTRSQSTGSTYHSMALTEQRLQQREQDLISYAAEDHHNDHLFETALGKPDMNMILGGVPSSSKPADAWGKAGAKGRTQSSFPPRWKQSRSCHVCAAQFSMLTKRRHHCRNCGQSVCGGHSTNRVSLPKYGLLDPQRICDKCFLSGHHMAAVLPQGSGSFGINSIASSQTSSYQPSPQVAYGR